MADQDRARRASIRILIGRRTVLWGLAGILACAVVYNALSDTLTMTAFYPAPNAAYYNLLSTADAYLAAPASGNNGKVGVGIRNPQYKFDIQGNANINNGGAPTTALNVSGATTISSDLTVGSSVTVSGVLSGGQGLRIGTIPAGTPCDSGHPHNKGLVGFNGGNAQFCNGSAWQNL